MVLQSLRKAFERVRSLFASGGVSQRGDCASARYQVVENTYSDGKVWFSVENTEDTEDVFCYGTSVKEVAIRICDMQNAPPVVLVSKEKIHP